MKVTVDQSRCVGQGMCALYAPAVFILGDEDGRAQVQDENVRADQMEAVRQAARACPEQAISIDE